MQRGENVGPDVVGGHQLALTRWLEGGLNLRDHKLHPKLIRDPDIDGLPYTKKYNVAGKKVPKKY